MYLSKCCNAVSVDDCQLFWRTKGSDGLYLDLQKYREYLYVNFIKLKNIYTNIVGSFKGFSLYIIGKTLKEIGKVSR